MRNALRSLHVAAAAVFVAAIVVQVFLAGAAIANLGGSGDFTTHREFGYTWVGFSSLAVLLTAIAARAPRRDVAITFGMLVLYIIQTLLPAAKASASWVAALHPVNAMLLFAISVWYVRHAWREMRRASATPSSPGSAPETTTPPASSAAASSDVP